MLEDCRECGQPVAARAKTCPHCGVKKPTATKAEAGLDAFAAGTFKLGVMICLLAVLVVACIAVVACTTDIASTPTPQATMTTATTTTTAVPTRPAEPVVIEGTGTDITQPVTLAAGRWRVEVEVRSNIGESFAEPEYIGVFAFGESDYEELLVNDIGSGDWTGQVVVGPGPLSVPAGPVWFEVQAGGNARWTITVEPL